METLQRVRAFVVAVRTALRTFGGRKAAPADPDRLALEFIQYGLQYYVSGRYATIAGFLPITGNLFHHAIEMLLKGCLARTHTEGQLFYMRHRLKRLWRAFKDEKEDAALCAFDTTVAQLHKFEDIRYPDTRHGMLAVISLGVLPGEELRGRGGERHYRLSVAEVDELVKAIIDRSGFNPLFFEARFRTTAARQFFSECNEHPIWK